MWLVDSQCGIMGILLNFHKWTGVKNFRPESGVKFFIHEIFHTWNRCEFSIRHVQPSSTCEILNLHTFQTCFWCESGMKQAWSYENILYGSTRWLLNLNSDIYCSMLLKFGILSWMFENRDWESQKHTYTAINQYNAFFSGGSNLRDKLFIYNVSEHRGYFEYLKDKPFFYKKNMSTFLSFGYCTSGILLVFLKLEDFLYYTGVFNFHYNNLQIISI